MTARANTPQSIAIMAKRADTTPKVRTKRGQSKNGDVATARARGKSTTTNAGAALVDINKPLTDKQKLFVRLWAQGESITSASVRAGYSDGATYAYRMVNMPNVLALYHQEKAAYEEASQMTRKKVMDGLLEAVEMAKLMAEPATMVSGWREIGKMCGYYAPVEHKMKIDVTGNIVIDRLNSMSDTELLEVISKQAGQVLSRPDIPQLTQGDEDDTPE